jgi:hypothetical protein
MPMCRRPYSVIPLLGLLSRSLAGSAAEACAKDFDHVPLMPGLDAKRGATLVIDRAAGRTIEATATGRLDRRAVLDFYGAALPQLGWQRIAEARFARARQTLALGFTESAGALTVRFSIAPH